MPWHHWDCWHLLHPSLSSVSTNEWQRVYFRMYDITSARTLYKTLAISPTGTADLVLRPPQSVTSAINGTAAFNCSIANGTLQWEVRLNAVSLYWPFHEAALAARDINASYFSQQQSSLFIKATYANNGTSVRCLSHLQPEAQSAPVNLTVYGTMQRWGGNISPLGSATYVCYTTLPYKCTYPYTQIARPRLLD